jgi:hypothetical protein
VPKATVAFGELNAANFTVPGRVGDLGVLPLAVDDMPRAGRRKSGSKLRLSHAHSHPSDLGRGPQMTSTFRSTSRACGPPAWSAPICCARR